LSLLNGSKLQEIYAKRETGGLILGELLLKRLSTLECSLLFMKLKRMMPLQGISTGRIRPINKTRGIIGISAELHQDIEDKIFRSVLSMI
jgi:hypothetical protein